MIRDNRSRAKAAIIGLWVIFGGLLVMVLLYTFGFGMRIAFNNGFQPSRVFVERVGLLASLSFILFLITLVICAVTFILWFTRAYRNLHVVLPRSKKKYPFWVASIAWFIPVFNLVAPYQIATDLFDKTQRYLLSEGVMDLRPKYDVTKGSWWAISIASLVVIALSLRYMIRSGDFVFGFLGHIIGFTIALLAVIFAVKMIRNYREMEKLIQQVESGSGSFSLKEGDLLD